MCEHVGGERCTGTKITPLRCQALVEEGRSPALTSADSRKTGNVPTVVWAQEVSITSQIIVSGTRLLGVGWWNMSFPFQKAANMDSKWRKLQLPFSLELS